MLFGSANRVFGAALAFRQGRTNFGFTSNHIEQHLLFGSVVFLFVCLWYVGEQHPHVMSELLVFTITCLCGECSQVDLRRGWVCPYLWHRIPSFDFSNVQFRRQVWLDTWKCSNTFEDPFREVEFERMPVAGKVRSLGNEDCIDAACRLKAVYGSCGILNMASARHVGGGVWRGARAQEEELCRRSNLYAALWNSRNEYPLHRKVLAHKDIVFFKTGAPNYSRVQRSHETTLTVFTSPAVKASWPCNHLEEMRRRIDLLVTEAEKTGVVAMVFGAWGCGSFGLQSEMVAKLFKRRLMHSSIPVAHFSILDDTNGVGNYSAFRKILCSG